MNARGCLWAIIKTLLILAAFGAFLTVAAFPWLIPMPGRGTLNGSWIGEVRSNRGPRAWLLLFLEPSRESRPRISAILTGDGTPLGGRAVLCTAGSRFELFVSGDTIVWSGRQIDMLLRPAQPSPPHLRIEITGDWDGHTLDFTQRNRSLADILSTSGYEGAEPESARFVSARLRKGTPAEFDSACRTQTAGSYLENQRASARASHANGARRRSGARESVWGSPRGASPSVKTRRRSADEARY